MATTENQGRKKQLLQEINEVSFAVDDILLFPDTHPWNQEALDYYREMAGRRKELLRQYAVSYGPLTIDSALDTPGDTWEWMNQPFPWQEGGCR